MVYKYSTKLMKIQQNYGIGKRMLWCIGENNGNILPECSILKMNLIILNNMRNIFLWRLCLRFLSRDEYVPEILFILINPCVMMRKNC